MRSAHLAIIGLITCTFPVVGQIPDDHKPVIKKGMAWLIKQQKKDGSWRCSDPYPFSDTVSTSFAGLALLAEGSTATKGMYADNIDRATEWLVRHSGTRYSNGLLTGDYSQGGSYMFGHGYAMLFLASVCARFDVPEDGTKLTLQHRMERVRRKELQEVLKRAVAFTVRAQIPNGGWTYVMAGSADEGAVTLCQIHALRAAKMAGVAVPDETMKMAYALLKKNTTERGGLVYTATGKEERPPLTIAAIACAYDPADFNKELPKKWIKFSDSFKPMGVRFPVPDYTYLHAALVLHGLGEKGFAHIFGKEQRGMKWSEHRKLCFEEARDTQKKYGDRWDAVDPGANQVYATAIRLIVLQLDNEAVPIFRANAEAKKK